MGLETKKYDFRYLALESKDPKPQTEAQLRAMARREEEKRRGSDFGQRSRCSRKNEPVKNVRRGCSVRQQRMQKAPEGGETGAV